MFKRNAVLAGVLVLSACAGFAGGRSVLTGCEVYAGALKTLAVERAAGNLSAGEVAVVEHWRPILNGVCLRGTPAAGSDAFATLEAGLIALAGMRGG